MHEFMTEFVVTSVFGMIITLEVWAYGYLIVKLVKWIKKKIKGETAPEADVSSDGDSE